MVDLAFVHARLGPVCAGDDIHRIGVAEGDVAGGVLVERGVEVEHPRARNRRAFGHQRHFAKAPGALVGGKEGARHVGVGVGVDLHRPAAGELHHQALDDGAVDHRGLGEDGTAFGAASVGHRENLFGRQVRRIGGAVFQRQTATGPDMALGKPQGEVGAAALEVQRVEGEALQMRLAGIERFKRRAPGRFGVVVIEPQRGKDMAPELFHRVRLGQIRENLPCPAGGDEGHDVPVGHARGNGVDHRLGGLRGGGIDAGDVVGVLPGEQAGRGPGNGEPRRTVLKCTRDRLEMPAGGIVEGGVGAVAVARQRAGIVGIEREHVGGPGGVGGAGDPAHEVDGADIGGQNQFLPRFEAEAERHGELGEAVKLGFKVHGVLRQKRRPGRSRPYRRNSFPAGRWAGIRG